jgi:hypothetical protein
MEKLATSRSPSLSLIMSHVRLPFSQPLLSSHHDSLRPGPPCISLPPSPMVVSQERKNTKSNKAPRRVSVGIRKNIPSKKGEVVTRTEVSRKHKNRVVTKSTKLVVPMVPPGPPKPPDPLLLPPPDQDAPTPSKPRRKGPSRSAAVSLPLPPHFIEQTNVYSDKTRRVAPVQGGVF